ncbi:YibE/F family protein [uncultured Cetobacterium sp.]|uniref:YibE/F family protein n=1 Tax=uncultured Cetobacterium sp. TaxID=527638 RepID=UPI002637DCDF|nr:YibE/F family protein [uncultured Cetobacterium sp.]
MLKKLVVLFIMIFSISFGENNNSEEYLKGKIIKLESINKNIDDSEEEVKEIRNYQVEILQGSDKNKIITVEFPIYKESAYNIQLRDGEEIVLYKDNYDLDGVKYYITDADKRGPQIILVGLFVFLTILIAKLKGVRAIISLSVVIGIIYYIFLPGIAKGYSPIGVSTFCALLSSGTTIFIMTGFSKKGIVAILGAVAGVVFAGGISMYFSYKMSFTGFSTVESLNYISLLKGIKIKELVSAGVILGSMGAVMDVSMSISSALTELKMSNEDITKKELFNAGMRIGGDIIGTMVNTLILAYIGSGLLSILFIYLQKNQFPLIRILNFESVASDILRAFAGSIGILVAVPVTSYLSGIFYKEKKNSKKEL